MISLGLDSFEDWSYKKIYHNEAEWDEFLNWETKHVFKDKGAGLLAANVYSKIEINNRSKIRGK